jgi:hypothetical protein
MELTDVIVWGLASAGSASVIRAVVPTTWLLVKPFSCDLCISWWPSFAQGMWAIYEGCGNVDSGKAVLGATMLSIVALKTAQKLTAGGLMPFLQEAGPDAPVKE